LILLLKILFFFFVLHGFIEPQPVGALNLYMNRVVLLEGEELLIRDVVRETGDMQSLLDRPLGFATRRLSLIPPRLVRQTLKGGNQSSLIVVGSRCQVIPLAKFPAPVAGFYKTLLEFIDATDSLHDGRVEIEILSSPDIPAANPGGSPVFTLMRAERRLGYLAGRVDVSFRWAGWKSDGGVLRLWVHQFVPLPRLRRSVRKGEVVHWEDIDYAETDVSLSKTELLRNTTFFSKGESATARSHLLEGHLLLKRDVEKVTGAELASQELASSGLAGVKAGDRIVIIFHRGNVWLEIPGRTYRSGNVGDTITVYALVGHRRYTGIVKGPKEVEVEIP